MKAIILNGSPRKKWNTDLMLREAEKGAASVGAKTEYINLFDINYTGCRSCMACKRKGLTGVNAIGRTICHRYLIVFFLRMH